MLADFFTKPLQGSAFKKMRSIILNMINQASSTGVCWEIKILWENEETDQEAAPTRMRTLKTRVRSQNNGRQDQTKKSTKSNKNQGENESS